MIYITPIIASIKNNNPLTTKSIGKTKGGMTNDPKSLIPNRDSKGNAPAASVIKPSMMFGILPGNI